MSLMVIHDKISNRIQKMESLYAYILRKYPKLYDKIKILVDQFNQISSEYTLSSVSLIIENKTNNNLKKAALFKEYETYLVRIDIDNVLTRLINSTKQIFEDQSIMHSKKLDIKLNKCDKPVMEAISQKIEFGMCSICGIQKEMFPHLSELRCRECADIDKFEGTEFEEHAVQDPNKQKKGDNDPSRFVDVWIDRILAVREIDFTDKKTGKPEAIIVIAEQSKKDKLKNQDEITCEYIRHVWKVNGFTAYNDDAAYARFLVTGIRPKALQFKVRRFIRYIVIRVMKIFNQIKDPERSNSLYYAYVLYKIIKQFYGDQEESKLLESIHIQKDDTLQYNDSQYEKICKKHNETYKRPILIYEPTVPDRIIY